MSKWFRSPKLMVGLLTVMLLPPAAVMALTAWFGWVELEWTLETVFRILAGFAGWVFFVAAAAQFLDIGNRWLAGRQIEPIAAVTERVSPEIVGRSQDNDVDMLVSQIQTNLYGDDERLPYALALCLDLVSRVDLSDQYERWIRQELRGYGNRDALRTELKTEEAFESWMDTWASYRLIQTHIKAIRPGNTQNTEANHLVYGAFLYGLPINEVVKSIARARVKGQSEFAVSVSALGDHYLIMLQSSLHSAGIEAEIPSDLPAFYSLSDVENIVTEVRARVLSLLLDVRKQYTLARQSQSGSGSE